MNRPEAALSALLLASTALVAATPAIAGAPPQIAATARVNVPYHRFTLPNGLTVIVYTDHRVPTVFVGMWYRIGSKDEPEGKKGFAHLFEHLMFQQSANRKEEYFAPLERAGAVDINGNTEPDYTAYYQTVPTNAIDLALWMESDRMGYLAGGITQAVLDEQRRVVLNEKRQGELDPGTEARDRLLASFYPAGHPYAHSPIGTTHDVEAASLADVKGWFTDYYGAANAVLVLSGDIDSVTAKEKVARYFGAIRPGKPVSQVLRWTPSLPEIRREVVYGRFPAATLSRTWALSSDDPHDITLLQLAARSMTGRFDTPLQRALIEKDGIATAVTAEVGEAKLGSTFNLSLTLRPGVEPERAGRALDEALQRFLTSSPDPRRLSAIISASRTAIVRSLESNVAMADWLGRNEMAHADPTFFLRQLDWISAAKPAAVRAVAAKWLQRPYHEMILLSDERPPATGTDVDRTQPPARGPAAGSVVFPPFTRMTLSNGMTLVVAERHQWPLVDMDMRFDTGTLVDAAYGPGAAAAAFGMMAAGTRTRDAAALARTMEEQGINVTTTPGARQSSFQWNASVDGLDASFALAADMLRRPAYPQSAVDRTAAGARQRFDVYERDPMDAADALFARAVWGDADPRGHIAGRNEAQGFSREAIQRFHDREITPGSATLYMIGDITPERARTLAERHFGDWAPATPAPRTPLSHPPAAAPRIILVDAPGAGQSSVTVGALVPPFDRDRAAAELLAAGALADGASGRLNMNLREAKGWTYGFGGGIADAPEGERLFTAGGTVQTDKTAAAMADIRREITDYVTTRPISADELADRVSAATHAIPLGFTNNTAFLQSMIGSATYGLPLDRAATADERLSAVTPAQARDAARRLFRPDALTWVVVGDLRAIEAEVRALGFASVEVWDVYGHRLR